MSKQKNTKSQAGNYRMDSGMIVRADSHVGVFTATYLPAQPIGSTASTAKKSTGYKGQNLLRAFKQGGSK